MKSILLSDLIARSAEYGLTIQATDGSFPSGCNGPYNDPETPVRNTAHWLYLLAFLYIKTKDTRWKTAGENAADYLQSKAARPYNKTFYCRDKAGKDRCNGLIGQAWGIEALVKAAQAFDRQDCYDLAEEVSLLHPWDEIVRIWRRVEIDGTELPYDRTINHQLWFAAANSLLDKTPLAQERAITFLENVAANVQLYPDGVIYHISTMGKLNEYLHSGPKPFLKELRNRGRNIISKAHLYSKSVGYHGFNLYAFAILKETFPQAEIWKNDTFTELINVHWKDKFISSLRRSEYGYFYNLAGVEIALALETFFKNTKDATAWLNRQLKETFQSETHSFSQNAPDLNTSMARIYEATRLKNNYTLTIDSLSI